MKDLAKIRNDVVGSLLRPAELKQARQRFDDGQLSREELGQVEDREIRNAVRLQEGWGWPWLRTANIAGSTFRTASANRYPEI